VKTFTKTQTFHTKNHGKWLTFFLFKKIVVKTFTKTETFHKKYHGNKNFLRKLSWKLSQKHKFPQNEISRKFAHFHLIFTFRATWKKKRFHFNPRLSPWIRALGGIVWWKKRGSKISWHSPLCLIIERLKFKIRKNWRFQKSYLIPRKQKSTQNSTAFRDTEFRIISRNFGQFRIAYESKKKYTEFCVDGIP
jgi:hypothetical protein